MLTKFMKLIGLFFAGLILFSVYTPVAAQPGTCDPDAPMRVVWPRESASNTDEDFPQLSADGLYLLFISRVTAPGGGSSSSYRYDRQTCTVELASIGTDGQPVNDVDFHSISADGRYIAFNGDNVLYLRDMQLQTTVEVVNFYTSFNSLSADGRYLAYSATRHNGDVYESGVFVYDRVNDTHETIVPYPESPDPLSNNFYLYPVIAGEGRYIAILSNAALVAGDTNGFADVFLYDRDTQTMARITDGYDGSDSNGESEHIPDISADGRYVVFGSFASNLVPDDNNGVKDIFLYDRVSDSIERVSVNALGIEANGGSSELFAGISADGRYVTFDSTATNLHYGIETYAHVYVLDRDTGLLKLVTVTPAGEVGEGGAGPVLSDDGRFVAFLSRATDLAPGNDAEDVRVFLADWQQLPVALPGALQPETCDPDASVTVLLDDPEGEHINSLAPFISQDGRYVVYTTSLPGSLIIPYRYDRVTCETEIISITGDTTPYADNFSSAAVYSLSADGRYALFYFNAASEDLSGLYVQDMDTGVAEIVTDATIGLASISADGRFVVYNAYEFTNPGSPNNLNYDHSNLFLYDRDTDTSELIATMPFTDDGGASFFPVISDDNNTIVFAVEGDLPAFAGDTNQSADIFAYERDSQTLTRVTTGFDGSQPNGPITYPAVSADGRYIVYQFHGTNIVAGDTNDLADVFLYDGDTGLTRRISVAEDGTEGDGYSGEDQISISADGRYVTFSSAATNLIVGETHDTRGIYVYDQTTDNLWRTTVDDYYTEGSVTNANPMISRDGQWVAYMAYQYLEGESWTDLFIVEWQRLIDVEIEEPTPLPGALQPETCDSDASVTVLLHDPDDFQSSSSYPFISDDGRYVVYSSRPRISGAWVNIPYRYDRVTCATEIISITGDATPYTADSVGAVVWSLSGDGRYAVFEFTTTDTALSGIYIQDMDTGTVEKIPAEHATFVASISRDGRYVFYTVYEPIPAGPSGYPGEQTSLFLYDRYTGESELIYAAEEGLFSVLFFASIAEDNNRVVFATNANLIDPDEMYTPNWTEVFVYDRATQELNRITTGFDGSPSFASLYSLTVSANGRYAVYSSGVDNLAAGDTNTRGDVFVYDHQTSTTRRISVAADGTQGNGDSGHEFVSISADGRFIAFSSDATNLIVGETHDTRGIYVYDQTTDNLWRTTVDDYYTEGSITNAHPMISRDGQWLVYMTSQQVGSQYGGDLFIVEWQTLIDGEIEEPTPSKPDANPERNVVVAGESLLTWGEITWATGYEIQIDDDANFRSLAYSSAAVTDLEIIAPDLDPGLYYWRVRAQRANGSWGGWSTVDSFVVITP